VPFTVNIVNNIVDAWRGIPYVGYQDPIWYDWGYPDRGDQVLEFLAASQAAYTLSTGVVGGFAPAF
jgi:hypothetical protein